MQFTISVSRSALLFCLLVNYISIGAQNLNNTEWIKIKVEREDGSLLIDKRESVEDPLQYYFFTDSVYFSSAHEYSNKLRYSLQGSLLSIGDFAKYKIDSLDERFLILSQFNEEMPQNRLNRYYFINSEFLFDYLKRNDKLHLTSDSELECDEHICPTHVGNMFELFSKQLKIVDQTKFLHGFFILDSSSRVIRCDVDTSNSFSHKEVENVKAIISSTSGSWILPPTPAPLEFKISFALRINPLHFSPSVASPKPLYGIRFELFPKAKQHRLSVEQQLQSDDHFFNGNRLFEKGSYEKAASEFKRCISIDSLYIDAYYNLAGTYQKLGMNSLACGVWKQLSDMNQKQGEALYRQNCK
jgi:tetratricopeptide (TPR) repeat protein